MIKVQLFLFSFLFFFFILPPDLVILLVLLILSPLLTISPAHIPSNLRDSTFMLSYCLHIFTLASLIISSVCRCETLQCVVFSSNIFYFNTCAIIRCKLFPHATRANDKCGIIVEEFHLRNCHVWTLQQGRIKDILMSSMFRDQNLGLLLVLYLLWRWVGWRWPHSSMIY